MKPPVQKSSNTPPPDQTAQLPFVVAINASLASAASQSSVPSADETDPFPSIDAATTSHALPISNPFDRATTDSDSLSQNPVALHTKPVQADVASPAPRRSGENGLSSDSQLALAPQPQRMHSSSTVPLIASVVGARPNFMKMAPVVGELRRRAIPHQLIHTGQHYDSAMSGVFFEDLHMPAPDVHLGVGSGTHAQQTARVLTAFEDYCLEQKPALVIVAGDVNSTAACAMTAAKLRIPVAHVESGLRSFDRSMPEELNRIVTDHLSDLLFTTEDSGNRNLLHEGVEAAKICFTGNCMVDSLRAHESEAVRRRPWQSFGVDERGYALITLHRPSNVDSEQRLEALVSAALRIAARMPVLFPVHPRTRERLAHLQLAASGTLQFLDPQPYLTFLGLMARARLVLTDSGGIQEETTALGIPCLTLRSNTERPSTVETGTNVLVGDDLDRVDSLVSQIARGNWKHGAIPPLWDGHAAVRVVDAVQVFFSRRLAKIA